MNGQPKEPEVTPVVNPTDDGIDMSSCCCCYLYYIFCCCIFCYDV